MPSSNEKPPTGDFEDPHWYTYAVWFWGGMFLLWVAHSCSSDESSLYRAFEEMSR